MAERVAFLRRFVVDERATSTMEFVIMFPVVMLLFMAVFETGITLSRQVLLERSLESAARVLRLSQGVLQTETGAPLTPADIRTAICDNTRSIPNCHQSLVVEMLVIDTRNYVLPAANRACVNRQNLTIRPANSFQHRRQDQLVVIRTCTEIDRILPFSGFGLNLARNNTGGRYLVASAVFLNEPN
jgi:Flp pilus assembly protein TadG